ncbi:MAG: hypothetical protein J5858_11930, partial [Lentisphaeria bacterium]|nr:hypothetical protein [Lentisphaeria bacterium]
MNKNILEEKISIDYFWLMVYITKCNGGCYSREMFHVISCAWRIFLMMPYSEWNTKLNIFFDNSPEIRFFMARGWTLHLASGEMFSDELIAEFVYVCAEYWRNGQNSLGINHISNAAAHDSKELTAFLAFLSLVWHHDF